MLAGRSWPRASRPLQEDVKGGAQLRDTAAQDLSLVSFTLFILAPDPFFYIGLLPLDTCITFWGAKTQAAQIVGTAWILQWRSGDFPECWQRAPIQLSLSCHSHHSLSNWETATLMDFLLVSLVWLWSVPIFTYSKLLGSFWYLFGFSSGMIHLTLVWSELSSHPNYLDLVDSVWCFFGPFYKYAPRVDFLLVWLVWLWLTRVIHSSKLLAPLACHLLSCNTATNTFYNLGKYILQFGQIHFIIWTNIFESLGKYFLQFGQIHFTIWRNAFCDKYAS